MGMYTGLRGRILLKDNKLTSVLIEKGFQWEEVASVYFDETISAWASVGRCNFIPNGAVCYMPANWSEGWSVEGNVLSFTCSLKNYNNEIEIFITYVLPHIAEAWNLEKLYEESAYSTLISSAQGVVDNLNSCKYYDDYTGEELEQLPYIDVFSLELK